METNILTTEIREVTCQQINHYDITDEPNFDSPTKRSFLNECIRQIYLINGQVRILPAISVPAIFNKDQVWSAVNNILTKANHKQNRRDSLQRIKRQLFRECKPHKRKLLSPQHISNIYTESLNFRIVRHHIGVQRIRRNYLDAALLTRKQTERPSRKRKLSITETSPAKLSQTEALNLKTRDVTPNIISYNDSSGNHVETAREQPKLQCVFRSCRAAQRMKPFDHLLTQKQYQDHILTYSKALEESVRSIYYMKALLNLMMDHEEIVYV